MKRRTLLASGAAAATLGLVRPGFAQGSPLKVGFIYVGPINDGGWTQHHHTSAMKMKEHFGDAIELVYQENVPEGADAERAMTQMALLRPSSASTPAGYHFGILASSGCALGCSRWLRSLAPLPPR